MTFLILTHDRYAITSLVTLTLGSFFIANHLYERWLCKFNLQLIDANIITKLFIVIIGNFLVSWRSLFDATLEIQLIVACCSFLIGYACLTFESYLISLLEKPHSGASKPNQAITTSINNIFSNRKKFAIQKCYQPSYFSIITVGILEEILYRGFLSAICISLLSPSLCFIALICVTFIFALNHLNFGNIHVLTKFILGFSCLMSFLVTKTVLAPIVIHATFNVLVVNQYRKIAYG